jgi:DnaJ-class molecular chaperone
MNEGVEDDSDYLCGNCNGSGEGMYDGSICGYCKGSGVRKPQDDDWKTAQEEYEAERYWQKIEDRNEV